MEKREERVIDELGRVVIPKEVRNELDFKIKEKVDVYADVENRQIIIKQSEPKCCHCNNTEKLTNFKGKSICRNCLDELQLIY